MMRDDPRPGRGVPLYVAQQFPESWLGGLSFEEYAELLTDVFWGACEKVRRIAGERPVAALTPLTLSRIDFTGSGLFPRAPESEIFQFVFTCRATLKAQ